MSCRGLALQSLCSPCIVIFLIFGDFETQAACGQCLAQKHNYFCLQTIKHELIYGDLRHRLIFGDSKIDISLEILRIIFGDSKINISIER